MHKILLDMIVLKIQDFFTTGEILFVYTGLAIKIAIFILVLWLFLRLMKFLKLQIQYLEKKLGE